MYVPFRVFLTVHSINFLQSEERASLSTINPLAESTPSSVFIPDFPTPRASVYCPTDDSPTRMAISQTQLDHFLDFITSPHVIQDLPYGEKSIKLSTKEIITVPNVVRMMIPESIVKQYLIYAEECAVAPQTRSTLLSILSICSASVRKSLQGVDYISSAGSQAFDDLSHVVDRLGEK